MLSKVALVVAGLSTADGLSLRGMNATPTGMNKTIPAAGVYESGYNEYGKEVLHKNVATHTDDWLNEQYIGAHPAEEVEDMDVYTARICAKNTQGDHTYAAKNGETEFCRLFLAGRQGLFLAQYAAGVVKHGDPKGDDGNVQDGKTYETDYVKDDRPNMTGVKPNVVFSYAGANAGGGSSGSSPAEGTAAWYKQQCDTTNAQCKLLKDHRLRIAELDLKHFENDYIRQKRILDSRTDHHLNQKADVAQEKADVARARVEVKAAKIAVKEKAHCPPELEAAKAELARLEAIANKVPADIDAECKAQQRVLDAQQCVEEFRAAEAVLAENQDELQDENGQLHDEKKDVNPAAVKLPPQEKRVADALAAWEEAKAKNILGSIAGIESTCQNERNKLIDHAGIDLDALRAYWLKQKAILKDKEDTHNQEKGDVVEQKGEVKDEAAQVAQAKVDVKEKAHCPPELVAAKAALAKLQGIPNKQPADIDAECKAEHRVHEAEKCVDEYNAAQAILQAEKADHSTETQQLHHEVSDVADAKAALPPQGQKVDDARAALDAAMALMKALESCHVE